MPPGRGHTVAPFGLEWEGRSRRELAKRREGPRVQVSTPLSMRKAPHRFEYSPTRSPPIARHRQLRSTVQQPSSGRPWPVPGLYEVAQREPVDWRHSSSPPASPDSGQAARGAAALLWGEEDGGGVEATDWRPTSGGQDGGPERGAAGSGGGGGGERAGCRPNVRARRAARQRRQQQQQLSGHRRQRNRWAQASLAVRSPLVALRAPGAPPAAPTKGPARCPAGVEAWRAQRQQWTRKDGCGGRCRKQHHVLK